MAPDAADCGGWPECCQPGTMTQGLPFCPAGRGANLPVCLRL